MNATDVKKAKHTIKAVAIKTGLSTHLIRAWERRYNAVRPQRSDTNRRLYSDEDIRRLALLRKVTKDGESIGQIANLPLDELIKLADSMPETRDADISNGFLDEDESPSTYVELGLQAARNIDQRLLESILLKAAVNLSQPVFLQQVMEPLMYKTGELWRSGGFKVFHEHVVSAVVRTILVGMINTQNIADDAPAIVVTTPAGQVHEFGALLAAVTAASDGWHVIYLGPNIPIDDIANAVKQQKAGVIALSIVYLADDSTIAQQLTGLRKFVGKDVKIFVGGKAAGNFKNVFSTMNGIYIETLEELRRELENIRN